MTIVIPLNSPVIQLPRFTVYPSKSRAFQSIWLKVSILMLRAAELRAPCLNPMVYGLGLKPNREPPTLQPVFVFCNLVTEFPGPHMSTASL